MKRNFKVLAAFGLAAAMMISSAVPSLAIGGPISANKTETKEEVKYEFKSGETVISMGAEAAGILTALGRQVPRLNVTAARIRGRIRYIPIRASSFAHIL